MEAFNNIRTLEKELGIKFITCNSSNIEAFGFDNQRNTLWVLFKRNLVYKYPDQTPESYEDLCKAESKGKWVNDNLVKSKAPCERYRIK